jgi:hypothetical protein
MFRRRFRILRNMAVDPSLIQMLAQANRLSAEGKPAQAAPIYSRAAGWMESHSHHRRAANLYALAAHAFADARNEPLALAQAQAALRLFIQTGMVERAPRFYTHITAKLHNDGMDASVQALRAEFGHMEMPAPQPAVPDQPRRLPLACPQCGAPARSDEVSWVDRQTAECPYCGALLPAT